MARNWKQYQRFNHLFLFKTFMIGTNTYLVFPENDLILMQSKFKITKKISSITKEIKRQNNKIKFLTFSKIYFTSLESFVAPVQDKCFLNVYLIHIKKCTKLIISSNRSRSIFDSNQSVSVTGSPPGTTRQPGPLS